MPQNLGLRPFTGCNSSCGSFILYSLSFRDYFQIHTKLTDIKKKYVKKIGTKEEIHTKLPDIKKKYVKKIERKKEIHTKISRKVKKYVSVPDKAKRITY